jgi:hypothetical protein
MSKHAVETLLLHRKDLDDAQLLELWRKFSKFPEAGGMAGSVFEVYVHRQFRQKIALTAQRMFRNQTRYHMTSANYGGNPILQRAKSAFCESTFNSSINIDLITGHSQCVVYQDDSKNTNQHSDRDNVNADTYYQPQSAQQVGFDAFFVHRGHLYLLQYTSGKKHGVTSQLVQFLRERFDQLPNEDKWHFIFVIPGSLRSFSSSPDQEIADSLPYYTAQIPAV